MTEQSLVKTSEPARMWH